MATASADRLAHRGCVQAGYRAFPSAACPHPEDSPEGAAWRYGWDWAHRRLTIASWKPSPWGGRPPVALTEQRVAAFKGKRPRLVYWNAGCHRIAIGCCGEPFDSLAAEIARCYPDACLLGEPVGSGTVAEHVAGWSRAGEAAKRLKLRKAAFLDIARDPTAVEKSMVMDDDLMRRMWAEDLPLVAQDLSGGDSGPSDPVREPGPFRRAIWKTERTGTMKTRGSPILRKIGEECWYGGTQLHRSPPINGVVQRWKESELIGMPIPGDWGTPPRGMAALAEVDVHQDRAES